MEKRIVWSGWERWFVGVSGKDIFYIEYVDDVRVRFMCNWICVCGLWGDFSVKDLGRKEEGVYVKWVGGIVW